MGTLLTSSISFPGESLFCYRVKNNVIIFQNKRDKMDSVEYLPWMNISSWKRGQFHSKFKIFCPAQLWNWINQVMQAEVYESSTNCFLT